MYFVDKMQVEGWELGQERSLDSYIRGDKTTQHNWWSGSLAEEAKSQTEGKAVTLKSFHVKKQPKRAGYLNVF